MAQSILGHIGDTLTAFRPDKALASWGGLCPGNNQSATKRKSGKSPVRKHPFKELMIEIARAAVRTKGSYYKDKHYRLKSRRGAKRAIVAFAHRITKAVYHKLILTLETFETTMGDLCIIGTSASY